MKISIIGSNKEDGEKLKDEIKNFGIDSDFYPLKEISLYAGKSLDVRKNGDSLLSSSYIVLFPEQDEIEFCYQIAKISELFTNITPSSSVIYHMFHRGFMQRFLSQHKIPTRKIYLFSESNAAKVVLKDLKLPVILTLPDGKRIPVKNEETFQSIIAGIKRGKTISAEKPVKPSSLIYSLITKTDIASYEKSGEQKMVITLRDDMKKIAQRILTILNVPYVFIEFVPYKNSFFVNNISFSPDLKEITDVTGKNAYKMVAEAVIQDLKSKRTPKFIVDSVFGRMFRPVIRWFNEISHSRTRRESV